MRVALTGANGFLGWHTRCALKARGETDVVCITREVMENETELDEALRGADAVLHLAGVNRAEDAALRDENAAAAARLTASLDRVGATPTIVYANSIQSGNGTPFGDGKQAASDQLAAWSRSAGAVVADVRLPNLFGEHGRPHYNSVVATFCDALVRGEKPTILEDRALPLLHVQDAVDLMLEVAGNQRGGIHRPEGRLMQVSSLLEQLRGFHHLYEAGDIPNVAASFDRALFNTYRSFCFPDHFPIRPVSRTDERGHLIECLRAHGGEAQVFCSWTQPAQSRGQHFHLRKIERFQVLQGTAEIALRRLFHRTVTRFAVSGDEPAIIDMPTMWTHGITNTGAGELTTLFWTDEVLNPDIADTHREEVELRAVEA